MKNNKEQIDPVVKYPSGILRIPCVPIEKVDAEVKSFTQIMHIICKRYDAYGLAAPQVGKSVRVIVVDAKKCPLVTEFGYQPGDCSPNPVKKEYKRERHCYLINPVISNVGTNQFKYKEGCLSLPKVKAWVTRPSSFDVTFLGVDGKTYTEHIEDTSKDMYGIIVQHEVDHLDGVLMIDKVSSFDAMKISSKINKLRRK